MRRPGQRQDRLLVAHVAGQGDRVAPGAADPVHHFKSVSYTHLTLPTRSRGKGVTVRKLLPDPIPGMEIDRMELQPGGRMTGIPHTPGTHEYLMCESGSIELVAAGDRWTLTAGDVVAFRGDQKHSYANPGRSVAVGYSVVVLAKV